MRRRALLLAAVGWLAAAATIPLGARTPAGTLEYELKAAFLFNFARFVSWPSAAYPGPQSPFTICVFGEDPFGQVLDETVRGERLARRPMEVLRPGDLGEIGGCHILFVARSERDRYAEVLSRVNLRRVLTVSDDPAFFPAGGHVNFFLEGNRVRFALNADALDVTELQISSRLMQVGQVHRAPRPSGAR